MDAKISKGIGTNNREKKDERRAASMLLFEQGTKKGKDRFRLVIIS
jgi:hypothetical protein